jgi:hypothetical protein
MTLDEGKLIAQPKVKTSVGLMAKRYKRKKRDVR